MAEPFVIFTLPRSRSYWLSHWLSYSKDGKRLRSVGHDEFSRKGSIEGCLRLFEEFDGTVETGAAFAFPVIEKLLPKARFLVIQRDPTQCAQSIENQGFRLSSGEFYQRAFELYAISGRGIRTVAFEDLDLESCAKWIWAYCLDLPWDQDWWNHWKPLKIEVDMPKRKEELRKNAEQVAILKQEVMDYANSTRH